MTAFVFEKTENHPSLTCINCAEVTEARLPSRHLLLQLRSGLHTHGSVLKPSKFSESMKPSIQGVNSVFSFKAHLQCSVSALDLELACLSHSRNTDSVFSCLEVFNFFSAWP
jgi:hypothetical protein